MFYFLFNKKYYLKLLLLAGYIITYIVQLQQRNSNATFEYFCKKI